MIRWEYDTVYTRERPTVVILLNRKGQDGWELVSVTPFDLGWLYHFKRPIDPKREA